MPVEVVGESRPSRNNRMAKAAEVTGVNRTGISRGMERAAQMVGVTRAGVHSQAATPQDLHVTLWVPR